MHARVDAPIYVCVHVCVHVCVVVCLCVCVCVCAWGEQHIRAVCILKQFGNS